MSELIKRFQSNTNGRDLIVGDIHGHFTRLQKALGTIKFNPDNDRLFSVGDLVDRGPESNQAIEWLAQPWFFAVQGNHEDMAIRWASPECRMDPSNYAANGGAWNIGNLPYERQAFADAFAALPLAIELETANGLVGIVHAGCPFGNWGELTAILDNPSAISRNKLGSIADQLTWSRERIQSMDDSIIDGVRVVVVGHTPMDRPTSLGNTHFIDTAGWHPRGAGFTFFDVATLKTVTVPTQQLDWEAA